MKSQQLLLFLIVGILCFLLFVGCASKSAVKPSEPETARSAQAGEVTEKTSPVRSLEDITVLAEQKHCRLKVATTLPPTFTIFKLTNPQRIIIDLPETLPGNTQNLMHINNSWITSITSIPLQDNLLRIEVGLTNDFLYNARNENNEIVIDISPKGTSNDTPVSSGDIVAKAPPAAKPAVEQTPLSASAEKIHIKDVQVTQTSVGAHITVTADAEIEKYYSYSLHNPARLAIDVPKAVSLLSKPQVSVGDALIDKIRVGQQQDTVSVVIDFPGSTFPLYQIAQEKKSLNIIIQADQKLTQDSTNEQITASTDKNQNKQIISDKPSKDIAQGTTYTGEKISLDFKDADIKNVLRLIADISGLNMIVSDNVQGKVTLKLDNIPWDEAFDIILETNNAGKIVTKNVTRIESRDQIKRINEEKLLAKKSQEQIEELVVKTLDISYAKAGDLSKFIKKMNLLSPRGSVNDFRLTNKLTIQDIPDNVVRIIKLVKEQDIPTRQVMIEAKIIQSNPSYVKELGIRWGGTYTTNHDNDIINIGGAAGDDFAVNLPAAAGEGTGGAINFGYIKDNLSLNVQLSALENEDKIKIISNPRILGLDNKEARIKQGVALPYLKLSEEGVTSTEFKDAVLELEVLPKITPTDTIALHIFVTKNQKSSQTGAGNEPGIDVREVETDLLVQSGETVVIGGIYETQSTINIKKVPFFGDVPYVGRFFRNEREEELLTELLVFLTVTVVDLPANIAKGSNDITG